MKTIASQATFVCVILFHFSQCASTNLIERHFIVARKAMPEAQSALARTEPEVDASQVIAESIFPEDDALNTEAETVPPPEDESEEAVSDTSSVEEVESVSTSDQARAEVTAQLEAVANFPFNADLTLLAEDLKRLNGILADQAAQVTQLREAGTITSSEASEFQREIRGLQEALDVTAESDNFTAPDPDFTVIVSARFDGVDPFIGEEDGS